MSDRKELIPWLGWLSTSIDPFSGGWAGDTIATSSFSGCSSSSYCLRASSSTFLRQSLSFFLATCLRRCCSILFASINSAACFFLSWRAFSAVAWRVVILGGVGDNNCVVDKGVCLDGRAELDGRLSDCLPSRGANRQSLTKRSMLGGGRGQGCIEDSLDGPDHFAKLSHGGESELLIGWTLDSGLSFMEAAELTSLHSLGKRVADVSLGPRRVWMMAAISNCRGERRYRPRWGGSGLGNQTQWYCQTICFGWGGRLLDVN